MPAPRLKEKISKYVGVEDMEEKLALSNHREVHMSDKYDGHYVTIRNDGNTIRLISSGGHYFKYCLGLEVMPNLPKGVDLRAELVFEKSTAKSSYDQFLHTNAMFSHCYIEANAKNPHLDFRDLLGWNGNDEHGVSCNIMLYVHGMVDHGHDLNTEMVAQYLAGADENIRQIQWTLVSSVHQAKQRLQAAFKANKEGLIFFVKKYEPAPGTLGCGKSGADSRSCSPEPLSQASRKVVGSEWIKGKLRVSFTGKIVMVGRHHGRFLYTVELNNCPAEFAEVKVRLGNTHGFDTNDNVRVDVIPNSYSDRRARHVIGMGVVGASAKRKRD